MVNEVIRRPVAEDIDYLVDNIRPEDQAEITAFSGLTIREALSKTPNLFTRGYVWEVEGKVVSIFGINPHDEIDGVGIAWLLGTTELDKYSKLFIERCRAVFRSVTTQYDFLYNYVHVENTKSIRWLKWLGFDLCDAEPIGIKGAAFHRFEMINV